DAPELVPPGRVVPLVDPVAVLVEVVRRERELHRLRVDLDDDLVGGARPALVRRRQRVHQDVQQRILRQTLLLSEQADRFGHVEIAHDVCSFLRFWAEPGFWPAPGFGAGPHSKTVLARSIWSKATVRSTVPSGPSTATVAEVSSAATSVPVTRRSSWPTSA